MKRSFLLTTVFTCATLLTFLSFSGGSPGGYSGAPNDNNGATCANGSCHIGPTTFSSELLSTSIPDSGYVPGEQYDIGLLINNPISTTLGFELAVRDSNHNMIGQWIITDNKTRLSGDQSSVTHSAEGNTFGFGLGLWNMAWKADSSYTGSIFFYGAVNVANGDTYEIGDSIVQTMEVFHSAITTAEDSTTNQLLSYPSNHISVRSDGHSIHISSEYQAQDANLFIHQINGTLMTNTTLGAITSIATNNWPSGIYVVSVPSQHFSKKIYLP